MIFNSFGQAHTKSQVIPLNSFGVKHKKIITIKEFNFKFINTFNLRHSKILMSVIPKLIHRMNSDLIPRAQMVSRIDLWNYCKGC